MSPPVTHTVPVRDAARAYDALVLDHGGVLPPTLPPTPEGLAAAGGLVAAVLAVRRAGVRTALLSNAELPVTGPGWALLLDAALTSGELGVRKPDPRAYLLVARRLGVAPQRCVFVDDLPANVRGAAAAGMTGVLHRDDDTTLAELAVLLPLPGEDNV